MSSLLLPLTLVVGVAISGISGHAVARAASQGSLRVNALHVRGTSVIDGAGQTIQVIGLNRSGTEYACAQGWGIFDGPSGPSVISSMRSWSINAVRVPLNEDCWLGINVVHSYSGVVYRAAIEKYVSQLSAQGVAAILDLHWSAPGSAPAEGQQEMPDADHSVAFWRSVARTFRSNDDVAFELYNEPHGVTWHCWVSGCAMPGGWQAVGMQPLIDAVRATGAAEPIIVDGLQWGNDLSGWLSHPLVDPEHQLVAGFHLYPWNSCVAATCWMSTVGAVAKAVPVVATEVGEDDCRAAFVTTFFDWAAKRGIGVLAWTWNNNQGCLSLIRGPDSGATPYGASVRATFGKMAASEQMPRINDKPARLR